MKRKDATGTDDICVTTQESDENPMNDLATIGGRGGGGGCGGGCGRVADISSSYYAMQNVRAYDSWWTNSCYNPNMTWSNGAAISKLTTDATFNSFIENPHSLKGKTASDMSEILGDTWIQGTYGSAKSGWRFIKGDKMIAYHPGGGRHSGSYYILSSAPTGRAKFVGPDYVATPNDGATIIRID